MAILFRNNPMPTTGAIYVENPRRKMSRRDNGAKDRLVAKQLGISSAAVRRLKRTDYAKYQAAFKAAGGEKARKARVASGKERRAAAKKIFSKASGRSTSSSRKRKSSGSRTRKSIAAVKRNKSLMAKLKRHAKDSKWTLFIAESGLSFKDASKLYKQLKTQANPKKRRNAVAVKTNPKRKSKRKDSAVVAKRRKKVSYRKFQKLMKGCGLSSKQMSRAYKKYLKSGRIPAGGASSAASVRRSVKSALRKRRSTRKGQVRRTARRAYTGKSSAFANAGKQLRKLGYKGKLSAKSLDSLAKRRAKIKALKAKKPKAASSRKSSAKKVKKSTSRARRSHPIFGRKPIISQFNQTVKDIRGGKSISRSEQSKLARQYYRGWKSAYEKAFKRAKKQGRTAAQARTRAASSATQYLRAQGLGSVTRIRAGKLLQFRRNPQHSKLQLSKPFKSIFSLINSATDAVAQVPVVGRAAPFVPLLAIGATVGVVHGYVGKYVGPKLRQAIAGTPLAAADRYGYTLIGFGVYGAIKLAQYFNVAKTSQANQVAALAIVTGAMVDALDMTNQAGAPLPAFLQPNLAGGGLYEVQPVSAQYGSRKMRRSLSGVAATQPALLAKELSGVHHSAPVTGAITGAANAVGAPMGYGAMMFTGAGY